METKDLYQLNLYSQATKTAVVQLKKLGTKCKSVCNFTHTKVCFVEKKMYFKT